MRAATLSSTLIARIAYDEEARTLRISFRNAALYCYFDVPAREYEALKAAPSAGRYYNARIKGRYSCAYDPARRRFRPPEEPPRRLARSR